MTGSNDLDRVVAEVNDLLNAANLLTWDARTTMPPGGHAARARQVATLNGLARDRLASDDVARLLDDAEASVGGLEPGDARVRAVRAVRDAHEYHRRVPAALTREIAELRGVAGAAWEAARRASDFQLFAPHLDRMVRLQRELAACTPGVAHPYDALVDLYEPGMTAARLRELFGVLRGRLTRLLRATQASATPPRDDVLRRAFPAAAQREFALDVARAFGYDLDRGRLDVSAHPFEVSFTRDDVRITTRFREDNLATALFGTLHETGHALYEQNVDAAFTRSALTTDLRGLYAVGGTSFGAHESQSRLWENLVGRSRGFWTHWFPRLQARFPGALDDVDAAAFYRAVNAVRPSLIRVEADEVTYDLHIMLRVELEMRLIEGSLDAADVPEAWAAITADTLGLTPPDDARGALQDIHWSTGYFGSFPTYTVGNVMASQFLAAARRDVPGLDDAVAAGEYAPLRAWLTERVYRHGRALEPDELLERATGRTLDPEPYLNYLEAKFAGVYELAGGA